MYIQERDMREGVCRDCRRRTLSQSWCCRELPLQGGPGPREFTTVQLAVWSKAFTRPVHSRKLDPLVSAIAASAPASPGACRLIFLFHSLSEVSQPPMHRWQLAIVLAPGSGWVARPAGWA